MMGLHSLDISDNPLSYMANSANNVAGGSFNVSGFPSLFVLAAEAVATHNWRLVILTQLYSSRFIKVIISVSFINLFFSVQI